MEWCILDAIGPFFRGLERTRINWSKIPFEQLAVCGPEARAQWDRIAADLTCLVTRARQAGFNAVTLDDVAHLAPHPYHGPGLNRDLAVYRAEFGRLFQIISGLGMAVFLTSDAIPCSAGVLAATGGRRAALDEWFRAILLDVLDAFPEVRGIILRIGESDGTDVRDALRSRLHLRNSGQRIVLHRGIRPAETVFPQGPDPAAAARLLGLPVHQPRAWQNPQTFRR